jgi:predicted transcriptional regulator
LETTLIAQRLNISVANAKSIIRSLFVKGIVDTDEVDTFAAYLTPQGNELAGKK